LEQAQAKWIPVVAEESLAGVGLYAKSGFQRLRKEE
jgi:hypothetical protein